MALPFTLIWNKHVKLHQVEHLCQPHWRVWKYLEEKLTETGFKELMLRTCLSWSATIDPSKKV